MVGLFHVIVLQISLACISLAFPYLEIANGTIAVPHSHPYLAYLTAQTEGLPGVWHCVGTVISPSYILTAAQCLDEASFINVTLGLQTVSNASTGGMLLTSTSGDITRHSRYTKGYLYGNIALVRLNQTLNFDSTGDAIKAANLANGSYVKEEFLNDDALISGWGFTDPYKDKSESDILLDATVKVVSNNDCINNQGFYLDNTIICTKPYQGSPCTWDEGGPLLIDGIVVGVMFNTATNCTNPETTTMYTRVPNYMDWIKANSDVKDNMDSYYYYNKD